VEAEEVEEGIDGCSPDICSSGTLNRLVFTLSGKVKVAPKPGLRMAMRLCLPS
jgi:hypothetical protein